MSPSARPGAAAGAALFLVLLLSGAVATTIAFASGSGGEAERRAIEGPAEGPTPRAAGDVPALDRLAPAERRAVLELARMPAGDAGSASSGAVRQSAPTRAPVRSSAFTGPFVNTDLHRVAGSQASTAVAVDRANPERMLAASNDAAARRPLLILSNSRLSSGSGRRIGLPTTTLIPGGSSTSHQVCCDPSLAAGENGIWVAATATAPRSRIVVNRLAPGAGFLRSANVGLPALGAAPLQHKPAIAVADGDRIAVAWIATGPAGQRAVISQCNLSGGPGGCDVPGGWSAPAPLTEPGGNVTMPSLSFGPSGDLYAVWWDAGSDNAVEGRRCAAGADCANPAAWDATVTVAGLDSLDDDGDGSPDPLPLRCPIIAAPGGLVGPSPTVAVGPAGKVLVTFSDLRPNGAPGNDTRCTASGSDRTFDSFLAVGAAPGELPSGTAERVSRDGPLDLNDHFLPSLTVNPDSGLVAVGYYTTGGDQSGLFADRQLVLSEDGGATLGPPLTLTSARSRFAGSYSDGIDYGDRQGIDAAPDALGLVWTDGRAIQGHDADLYALAPAVGVWIDQAPAGTVPDPFATVRFSTPAPRTRCAHNGSAFRHCSSPHALGPLPNRAHRFEVEAIDDAGNPVGAVHARANWTVLDLVPPETTITKRPRKRIKAKRPRFHFVADEVGATFQCRYDRQAWRDCRSPARAKVRVGRHTFRVRATDVGGNTDASPAVAKFRRMPACWSRKRGRARC